MTLETDNLHVVIRIPFKRPEGFIEPPSIRWTAEMEHKLWQYMSQKNTDWNYIADQLGVPTSYIIRHAAFIYETQLRGIHHQLRLSEVNKAAPAAQSPNIRHSTSTRSRLPSRRQTPTSRPPSAIYPSTSSRAESPSIAQQSGLFGSQQERKSPATMHDMPPLDRRDDSMVLSAISNIAPRARSESPGSLHVMHQSNVESMENHTPTASSVTAEKKQPISSVYESMASQSSSIHQPYFSPKGSISQIASLTRKSSGYGEKADADNDSKSKSEDMNERLDESETARHLEHIQEQMEELAFLPSHRKPADSRASLRGSNSLLGADRSDRQLQSTASNYKEDQSLLDQSRQSKGKARDTMQTVSSQFAAAVEDQERPATGSFITNLSDSLDSVTQSALEDAFMSNYNNIGSKMSSLAFSRRYPPSQ